MKISWSKANFKPNLTKIIGVCGILINFRGVSVNYVNLRT